jgi:hypothetical protein
VIQCHPCIEAKTKTLAVIENYKICSRCPLSRPAGRRACCCGYIELWLRSGDVVWLPNISCTGSLQLAARNSAGSCNGTIGTLGNAQIVLLRCQCTEAHNAGR